MAWLDDANNFYGCKDVSDRIHLDNTNLDKSETYLSLRSIGMHINHNYCLIDNVVNIYNDDDEGLHDTNYKNQLYVLYNLDKGFKSYASLATVTAGVAQSNALHCQEGYESKTSILLNAQPATTDYVQNLNEPEQDIIVAAGQMEFGPPIGGPPYEPNSPDWAPPSPTYDPNSSDDSPTSIGEPISPDGSPPPILRDVDTTDGSSLSSMDVQTGGGEIEPNCPQVTGGRRKTRRNKRKGGRKSRKMNKKTNKHRRSKKSKPAV